MSYYYFPGGHTYRNLHFDATGGPANTPCVWADDSLWSVDTPEEPHSILFLLHYRIWDDAPPVDLREAELQFRLRGEDLSLHGGQCYFWVVTQSPSTTRWHLTGQPIPITHGRWGVPVRLRIPTDPCQWHRSFASDPAGAATVTEALSLCVSYGFAFVGFSHSVTGRVALADFSLTATVDPAWPFLFADKDGPSPSAMSPAATASLAGAGSGLSLPGDYRVLAGPIRLAYLAFLSADAIGGRDVRNALLMVRQEGEDFDPMGGTICFFVGHRASDTRWVLRIPLDPHDTELYYEILTANPAFWVQVSGTLPLAEVLAGRQASDNGYDHLGFMVLGPQAEPRGHWGLKRFSIGPTLDARWAGP